MKCLSIFLLALLASPCTHQARSAPVPTDFSGIWNGRWTGQDAATGQASLTIHQTGVSVTGLANLEGFPAPAQGPMTGTVTGRTLDAVISTSGLPIYLTLTRDGSRLSGKAIDPWNGYSASLALDLLPGPGAPEIGTDGKELPAVFVRLGSDGSSEAVGSGWLRLPRR